MATKICPGCGVEFGHDLIPSKLKKRIYCSFECCRDNKRSTRRCLSCGKEFTVVASLPNKYCSRQCASDALVKPQNRSLFTCETCGAVFEGWTKRHPKYCSRSCAGIGHAKRITNPDAFTILKCECCGKEYKYPKRIQDRSHFCSRECRFSVPSTRTGVNHPRWKGGVKIYRGPNWQSQKKKALIRDNYTCQICGDKSTKRHHIYIDVHHITAFRLFNGDYKSANEVSNLITLCRTCHTKVDKHGLPCPRPLI